MATAIFRVSVLVAVLVILLLAIFCESSQAIVGDNRRAGSVRGGSDRRSLLRNNRIPNCSEMVIKSHCSQNSKCQWCRSEVLDDMCFPKSEASRLPTQVFSCD